MFSNICEAFTGCAVVTEAWPPNVPVATQRLSPMGIGVIHSSNIRLPFQSGAFDLVLNRHEELEPYEIARVLAPEGCVLTQQVGRNMWKEIVEFFPRARSDKDDGLFQAYQGGLSAPG